MAHSCCCWFWVWVWVWLWLWEAEEDEQEEGLEEGLDVEEEEERVGFMDGGMSGMVFLWVYDLMGGMMGWVVVC